MKLIETECENLQPHIKISSIKKFKKNKETKQKKVSKNMRWTKQTTHKRQKNII